MDSEGLSEILRSFKKMLSMKAVYANFVYVFLVLHFLLSKFFEIVRFLFAFFPIDLFSVVVVYTHNKSWENIFEELAARFVYMWLNLERFFRSVGIVFD